MTMLACVPAANVTDLDANGKPGRSGDLCWMHDKHQPLTTRAPVQGPRDLGAWQRSRKLTVVRLPPNKVGPRKEDRMRP
jgi:hypothetical protein